MRHQYNSLGLRTRKHLYPENEFQALIILTKNNKESD